MASLLARALVEDNIAEHVCLWFDGACVEVTEFDSVHSIKMKVEQCTGKQYE